MEKPTKSMMVYSVVFALIIMIPAWYFIKTYLEIRKMSPLDTREIIENVYAINNNNVNMFMIKGDDTYIAVDAGSDLNMVRQNMQALTIDPFKVKAVFLTHSDADHVAALSLFTNAKIYISKAEEQMIKGKASRFKVIHNKNISILNC
jgi:glyoxylase-like metal-dependent hydrolase (beta-lactamase superfamily II)